MGAEHKHKETGMNRAMTRSTSAPKEVTRELVAEWEKRRPALKALNDATLDKPRGFAIEKSRCVDICGGEKQFGKVAGYWKQCILWLRGITIEYEHASKSYRFIEVERHLTSRHQRVMASAEKKHRAEWQRLGVMRDDDMTDHQRRLRVLSMDSHSKAAGAIEASREMHRIALTQPETLPRVKQ